MHQHAVVALSVFASGSTHVGFGGHAKIIGGIVVIVAVLVYAFVWLRRRANRR
jgi:nicotinamide riboside transporter PnuC